MKQNIINMRNLLYFFAVTVMLMINMSCVQSQNEEKQIVAMLKEFYFSYNAVWVSDDEPLIFKNKLFSLQQKYCSEKLQNKIKKLYKIHGLDHDILINDLYADTISLKATLSITKDSTKENTYVVSYIANIEDPSNTKIKKKVIIHLTVVKEKESYKINEVW